MGGILISHCPDDGVLAESLRSGLLGLMDGQRVEFVSLTSDVSEEPVRDGMSAGSALVVLLSDSARRDSRVMTEAGLAVSLGKPVIVVIADETPRESLDFIEAQAWVHSAPEKSPSDLAHEVYGIAVELTSRPDRA